MMSYYNGSAEDDPEEWRFYLILEQELKRNGMMSNETQLQAKPEKEPDVHMKLKVKGSPEKIMFFHWLMTQLDPDWPFTSQRRFPEKNVRCDDCKGYIYRDNEYNPQEIRTIASQISDHLRLRGDLKVKVKMFTRSVNCQDVATVMEAQEKVTSPSEGNETGDLGSVN